jgi:hypothetical protein
MLKVPFLKKIIALLLLVLLSLIAPSLGSAQTNPEGKDSVSKFIMLSGHLNYAVYRDFATSPLFYNLVGGGVGFGALYTTPTWDHLVDFNMNAHIGNAEFFNFNVYYHYIHSLPIFKTPKLNLKLGGAFLYTQNVRINPPLRNAQAGLEAIMNVMLVGKLNWDISRTSSKSVKFFRKKIEKKPIHRNLSFLCQIGVFNFNFRPNQYSFVYLGSINGTATNPAMWLFEEYRWSWNGWRLGTQIEYSWYKSTGNGRKIAYIWEAAHCPGNFEAFQMGIHKIQYTIIINNNK